MDRSIRCRSLCPPLRCGLAACWIVLRLASAVAQTSPSGDIRVATPPVKSGEWHRLRPLGIEPRFRFVSMSDYRQAQLVVDPSQDIPVGDLAAYVSGGGRVMYCGQPAPADLFPVEPGDGYAPKGVGGVSWCAPGLGPLSAMFWAGHAGGPPCAGRAAAGTHVLAVMNDGSPFLAYRPIGRGGVLVVGRSDRVFMRDDLLVEAARFFVQVPLGPSLRVHATRAGSSSVRLEVQGSDPAGLAAKAELRVLALRYDPMLDKEIAIELPDHQWPAERAVAGDWSWTSTVPLSDGPAGRYLIAAIVRDAAERYLAGAVTWTDVESPDAVSVKCQRAAVLQGETASFRLSGPQPADLRWEVIGPNGAVSAGGQAEVAAGGEAAIDVPVGEWMPGRYHFRVRAGGHPASREVCFHIAPRRLDVPHWTGLHGITLHKEKTGLLLANWRAAGLRQLSWNEYPPDITGLCPKGGWKQRIPRFRECFDMAATAGVKISFWGENDKSPVPDEILESWGLRPDQDMVFQPPAGEKKGGGKCLTHPGVITAMRDSYQETVGTGLLTHPAFGLFTLGDEPGRFVRCCCARCGRRYRESMTARGLSPQDLGGRDWEQAFDIATRQAKALRANKLYFTELLRDWYAAMAEPFRQVPGIELTANHGGAGDFTFARDQYPYAFDTIFPVLEADVYPWFTCDDTSCVINWTGFTTSLLRSVSGFRKPIAVILNLSQARGREENRIQPVRRPPQVVPEDHYEQINVAVAEGAQRVEGFNGVCFVGLPPLGKMNFLQDRPEVMGLSDERFIREVLVPTAALQEVQRQTAAMLDLLRPLVQLPNRPATVALFQPAVRESWGGKWIGHFKQVMGGAPVDYIGEDLELLDGYPAVLLAENAGEDNVPPEAIDKLRGWVSRGNILVSARANIGGLFQEREPRQIGAGRTYLLGTDVKDSMEGTRLFRDILVREKRLPLAWTDYPFSTVGIKDLGETLYLFVLYYRSAVNWTPEQGAFGLVDGKPVPHPAERDMTITVNLPGPLAVYDCLEGGRLEAESSGSQTSFRARFRLARLKVFAVLPRPVDHLTVECDQTVIAGSPLGCRVRSSATHLVQVSVRDPRGGQHESWAGSFLTDQALSLPTYVNDVPGQWTLRVRDPLAGIEACAAITVGPPSVEAGRPAHPAR